MTLFAEILNAFSNAELSVALGIDESHARVMKVRGLIPIKHWDAIIAAAPGKGLDLSNEKLLQARKLRAAEMDAKRAERRAA